MKWRKYNFAGSSNSNTSQHDQAVHAVSRQFSTDAVWNPRNGRTKGNAPQFSRNPTGGTKTTSKLVDTVGTGLMEERTAAQQKARSAKSVTSGTNQECRSKPGKINTVSQTGQNQDADSDDLFIDEVTQGNSTKNTEQAYANVQVDPDKTIVGFKLDTGADTNFIPTQIIRSLGIQDVLEPSLQPLYGYGGEQLIVRGLYNIKHQYKDIQLMLKVYVVNPRAPSGIGLKAYPDFGLIQLILFVSRTSEVSILAEFGDAFKGILIGIFSAECTIHFDPNATPMTHPPRCVPITLCDSQSHYVSQRGAGEYGEAAGDRQNDQTN